MSTRPIGDDKVWTIAEAKARLSEILRLAESEGPQRIGTKWSYVVVAKRDWDGHDEESPDKDAEQIPIGQWLVEHWPRYGDLRLPDRNEPDREIPLAKEEEPGYRQGSE